MTTDLKKLKWRFIWVLPILLFFATGIPKLLQLDFMVENMTEGGMAHMILSVGIIEVVCAIIFLIPKTRKIGFLLCTAYIGGIITAEWIMGEPPIPGIIMQILLWLGIYFEYPQFFQIKTPAIVND